MRKIFRVEAAVQCLSRDGELFEVMRLLLNIAARGSLLPLPPADVHHGDSALLTVERALDFQIDGLRRLAAVADLGLQRPLVRIEENLLEKHLESLAQAGREQSSKRAPDQP